jgi:hypothetical protein
VARRKILKAQDRRELFDIPADEDSLIRHFSWSAADRLEIDLRRREHNKLGFAVQLCVMRHPGRVLAAGEIPPRAMLKCRRPDRRRSHCVHNLCPQGRDASRSHCAPDDLSRRQKRDSSGSSRRAVVGNRGGRNVRQRRFDCEYRTRWSGDVLSP